MSQSSPHPTPIAMNRPSVPVETAAAEAATSTDAVTLSVAPRFSLADGVSTSAFDGAGDAPSFLVETGANRRFKISAGVNAVIRLLGDAEKPLTTTEIVDRLQAEGARSVTVEKIEWLLDQVLLPRQVVISDQMSEQDGEAAKGVKKPSSYIWVKLPILSESFVGLLTGPLAALFRAPVAAVALTLAAIAHLYFYLQILPGFELAVTSLGFTDVVIIMLIANSTTLFHELGHASASRRYGVAPGPIGWGIYLFMFVLYADVSRVWRLKRWQRAVVDAGGMYFELIAASGLILLLATRGIDLLIYVVVLINISILFSFNPILRRDGYWILTDLSGQENLRYTSNQVLSSWARRLLGRGPRENEEKRPVWLQGLLGFYSIASVIFSAYITIWLGRRILNEVLPDIGASYSALASAFGSGAVGSEALASVGQILFGLVFVSIVIFSAWTLLRSVVHITMPGAIPEHTAGARVEWK